MGKNTNCPLNKWLKDSPMRETWFLKHSVNLVGNTSPTVKFHFVPKNTIRKTVEKW